MDTKNVRDELVSCQGIRKRKAYVTHMSYLGTNHWHKKLQDVSVVNICRLLYHATSWPVWHAKDLLYMIIIFPSMPSKAISEGKVRDSVSVEQTKLNNRVKDRGWVKKDN